MRKKRKAISILVITVLAAVLFLFVFLFRKSTGSYWTPNIGDSFQWQLSDYPVDLSTEADIFDVDLFETTESTINELHKKERKVVCYINIGAWEEYRDDAADFPTGVIGNEYEGWEGENWLDISSYEDFSSIMEKRFDLAYEKGCDGIEPDNSQNYQEDTGFEISYDDQLEYNIWIANQVHSRGMSVGLKNNPDQVNDLIEYYDWALLEDCTEWEFCGEFTPFIKADKPVFQVEYTDSSITLDSFCDDAVKREYYGLLKNRDLDSWISTCDKD